QIVQKYQALWIQRKADQRATLARADMSPEDKRKALAAFDAAAVKARADIDGYWKRETASLDAENDLVEYLIGTRSGWRPQGDNVIFTRPGLMEPFNAKVQRLKQVKADEQAYVNQINAQARQ